MGFEGNFRQGLEWSHLFNWNAYSERMCGMVRLIIHLMSIQRKNQRFLQRSGHA